MSYPEGSKMPPAGHPSLCSCPSGNIALVLRELGSWPETRRVTKCSACRQVSFLLDVTEGHPKDFLTTLGYEPIPLAAPHAEWLAAWPSSSPPPEDLPAELEYFAQFWDTLQCDASTPTSQLLACAALDAWSKQIITPLLAARTDFESVICDDVEAPGALVCLNRENATPRILEALMTRLEELPPMAFWRCERLCLKIEGLQASVLLPRLEALCAARATSWWNLEAKQDGRAQFHHLIQRCIERLST